MVLYIPLQIVYYKYSTNNILKSLQDPQRNYWLTEFTPRVNNGHANIITFLVQVTLSFCVPWRRIEEWRYSSNNSNLSVDGDEGSANIPAVCPRYTLNRKTERSLELVREFWSTEKYLIPAGNRTSLPRTSNHEWSHYRDYGLRINHSLNSKFMKLINRKWKLECFMNNLPSATMRAVVPVHSFAEVFPVNCVQWADWMIVGYCVWATA
jgi:hypothetical protein